MKPNSPNQAPRRLRMAGHLSTATLDTHAGMEVASVRPTVDLRRSERARGTPPFLITKRTDQQPTDRATRAGSWNWHCAGSGMDGGWRFTTADRGFWQHASRDARTARCNKRVFRAASIPLFWRRRATKGNSCGQFFSEFRRTLRAPQPRPPRSACYTRPWPRYSANQK